MYCRQEPEGADEKERSPSPRQPPRPTLTPAAVAVRNALRPAFSVVRDVSHFRDESSLTVPLVLEGFIQAFC
ncbi:hypothetical protein C470_10902 [Halorubrum distributum JCM 13561]|uniref:Uncharacterized protein n=1 Tax=Halorubrum distributum JCM 13561 TaxID=1227483 RepID=M0NPM4_9EURY|nr:hypothetical protein C470_10902 [Halorubrum litoreum JCM 13561]